MKQNKNFKPLQKMKISRQLNIFVIILILVLSGCGTKERTSATIDISIDYPKKDLSFQEIGGEIEYVPLETTNEVLLEQSAQIISVSDEKIAVINSIAGNIFLFGRNGKILSHFNNKGQSNEEYTYLKSVVYDEKNREFFVATYNRILVYSETGKYKRTFPYNDKTNYTKLSNFDDEILFVYDEFDIHGNGYRTKPYLFLSKKDGSIVSELDLNLPKRYSNMLKFDRENENGSKQKISIFLGIPVNWHDGDDFIIADMSSDTVYQLTKDKKLLPLLTRIPSVHGENIHTFLTVEFKTDKFMLLSKNVIDFEKVKRGENTESASLLYSFIDSQITETNLYNADCSDCNFWIADAKLSKNSIAALILADRITTQRDEGKLNGELKKIAEKLNEEDNQVVMIVKFK